MAAAATTESKRCVVWCGLSGLQQGVPPVGGGPDVLVSVKGRRSFLPVSVSEGVRGFCV